MKVTIEIEVPDGATHYMGNIDDDPVWFMSAGRRWFFYTGTGWKSSGCSKAPGLKTIQN